MRNAILLAALLIIATAVSTRAQPTSSLHNVGRGGADVLKVKKQGPALDLLAVVAFSNPCTIADRSFLVVFDRNRADLTLRAQSVIDEAAQATTRVVVTRIEVAGPDDRNGRARHSEGLSKRRVANIAVALIRLGVLRRAIIGPVFGNARFEAWTSDGVREPPKYRVEIVLR